MDTDLLMKIIDILQITINVVSGSSGDTYLSPNFVSNFH
jgi:hypothetical protein